MLLIKNLLLSSYKIYVNLNWKTQGNPYLKGFFAIKKKKNTTRQLCHKKISDNLLKRQFNTS